MLAAVSLLPLLKLLILYLGCQGSAALLQPVSDSRVVEAVGAVAKGFYFCWQQLVRRWCYLRFRSRGGVCEHERGLFCGVEDGSNYSLGGEYRQLSSVSDRSDRAFART